MGTNSAAPGDLKGLLGQRIKVLRLERGYSQEQFANRCGLDRTYVASIERGRRNATINTIGRIAKGLDMPVAELFNTPEFWLHGNDGS